MNRCCEAHFSWRIKQCMNNNRPVYIPVGDITCEKKADIDDWEIEDSFESLELCCLSKRSWAPSECIDESSQPMSLRLKFDLKGLPEPTNCQDSNRIANSLEDSLNVELSGSGGTASVM